MSSNIDVRFAGTGNEKQFIRQLHEKDASTIRFIDHNNKDYFTCLEDDAELIADEIYKTRSVIKTSDKTKYVTISPQVFQTVLKFCLLEKQFRVEIYNNRTYQLLVSGTAGNLEGISKEYGINFEFQDCSGSSIAAIKLQGNSVGVCIIEDSKIYLCEFEDNELYSNLEGLLLQFGIKEVVLPNLSEKKLLQVINKIGNVVVSTISAFNTKNIEQDLVKLLEEDNIQMMFSSKGMKLTEYSLSLSCCNALVAYLELLENDSKHFSVDKYDLSAYMKLDSSTIKALNVFPEFKSTSINSIFELLNKCKTSGGSRLLSQWLKQPLTNVEAIEERQSLVQLLMEDASLRVAVQNVLTQVPDIKRLLKKMTIAIGKIGNENKKLEDLVRLYQLVLVLPDLIEVLKDQGDLVIKYWLDPISKHHQALLKFQELVETTVDLKGLSDLNSNFDIRPEFDASLVSINERKQSSLEQIKQLHLQVADDLNMDSEKKLKLEQHQQHGYCLRLTRNDSVVLRNNKNYIELQTVKAGVYFTTAQLRKLSQVYSNSCDEYNIKQRELIREVLSISLTYQGVFSVLSLDLSHLDVITSFANVALLAPTSFTKPKLIPMDSKERRISLHDSRHPLLEVQDHVDFIPNDVSMGNKFFNIITGPNMGGKSTYLKQIATTGLMAQVGSFIPAESGAELPVFDAILSRVGAGDSQLKGLSTFMIEMLETSSILATATSNSLLIIDELGRGTSTYDGFGLAWSISEHLIQTKKCFALFATHFHELNKLAEKYPHSVENLHVVAYVENKDDITLMYKIEPGISSKSFGINVAEMVKFPPKIINMAKRKADELQNDGNLKKSHIDGKQLKSEVEELKSVLKKWREENHYDVSTASESLKELLKNTSNGYISELIQTL
ncbi:Msh2 DNA mismatch repair factor [Candida orthopsilosis Co 90-125]|uniref:Msh2 DNA mismatch repair factor n=1 Tax=Candida orthopsilosis (strain 90-125) TaxID=1136231 RepID=H8WZ81_CANO9|nr:Msh2 DNA mismatch repair factor [Candida orthopsilosis Co 90-125]CCG21749.1 Msh2 DNA mismatch repair factor [Candida orthopsilosis Co 90-125]